MSLLVACNYILPVGHASHDLDFQNATDITVLVYERTPRGTTEPWRIAPGGVFEDQVIVPGTPDERRAARPRRIEATDTSGNLVFCASYSYEDLNRIAWRIVIEKGRLAC